MTPLEARNDIAKAYKYASFMDLLVACVNKKTPQALEEIVDECMTHYASFAVEEKINKPQFTNFVEAMKCEMAHHEKKWGDESPYPPHHFQMVLCYLLGKLAKSIWEKDKGKFEHHLITLGAVAGTAHKYLKDEKSFSYDFFISKTEPKSESDGK